MHLLASGQLAPRILLSYLNEDSNNTNRKDEDSSSIAAQMKELLFRDHAEHKSTHYELSKYERS